jgi:hypothetical protein
MNIREILNFKSSIDKVKLDKENNQDSRNPAKEDIHLNDEQEMPKSLRDEWNQEYELIYLSYVLER